MLCLISIHTSIPISIIVKTFVWFFINIKLYMASRRDSKRPSDENNAHAMHSRPSHAMLGPFDSAAGQKAGNGAGNAGSHVTLRGRWQAYNLYFQPGLAVPLASSTSKWALMNACISYHRKYPFLFWYIHAHGFLGRARGEKGAAYHTSIRLGICLQSAEYDIWNKRNTLRIRGAPVERFKECQVKIKVSTRALWTSGWSTSERTFPSGQTWSGMRGMLAPCRVLLSVLRWLGNAKFCPGWRGTSVSWNIYAQNSSHYRKTVMKLSDTFHFQLTLIVPVFLVSLECQKNRFNSSTKGARTAVKAFQPKFYLEEWQFTLTTDEAWGRTVAVL